MTTDITSIFESYRECIRHIWNQFYLPVHINRKNTDPWHGFNEVENLIFYDLVLRPLGYSYGDFFSQNGDFLQKPFLPFRIVPTGEFGVSAMISREAKLTGYWDHPIANIPLQTDLRFLDLFDWDENAFRSFQYFQSLDSRVSA